jgi:hypothetical protein
VTPLAGSIGIQINTSIDRDDAKEVAHVAKKYDGPGNVLICWEHHALAKIVKEIGVVKYGKHVKNGYVDGKGGSSTQEIASISFGRSRSLMMRLIMLAARECQVLTMGWLIHDLIPA